MLTKVIFLSFSKVKTMAGCHQQEADIITTIQDGQGVIKITFPDIRLVGCRFDLLLVRQVPPCRAEQ